MKTVFILVASVFSGIAYGQTSPDSLLTHEGSSAGDTSQVFNLISLSEKLKYDEPKQASNYAKEALELASSLNFERGIVEGQLAVGSFLEMRSSYDSALMFFEKALLLSENLKYKKGIIEALLGKGKTLRNVSKWDDAIHALLRCSEMLDLNQGDSIPAATTYNHLGNIYSDQNQFEEALNYYQKCIALLKDTERTKAVATLNIGLIHFRFGDLSKALEYYQKCLKSAELLNEKLIIAHCYQKIGMVKRSLDEYDEAKKYYNLAIKQFELINDRSMVAYLHSNIANIYSDQEDHSQAIEQLIPCLQIQEEIGDLVGQCYTLANIGTNYMKMGKYPKAEQYLLRAQQLSSEVGVELINKDAAMRLSELYAKQEKFKKAYEYHVVFKTLEDSIFNETRSNQIAEMEAKFQNIQKEKEIALLNAENEIALLKLEEQKSLRNSLIAIVTVILILSFVLFNQNKVRAKANKKLKELDQLKTNFFTNISHEFRTPLTLILSPVEKILHQDKFHDNREDLTLIEKNANRLLELINQLLDLAKLDSGKLSLKLREGNITHELKNIASSFESLAIQYSIDFRVEIHNESIKMFFDSDKLQKIISNLLSNAFKYTPEKGLVQMISNISSTHYIIAIKDTGPGIPKEQQDQIFQRFHQLDQSTRNKYDGTGIGLALTKELVELHHGTLEVRSLEGNGSEFTVSLPINEKRYNKHQVIPSIKAHPYLKIQEEEDTEEAIILDEREGTPIVLVVEDNDDLRSHIRSLLCDKYVVNESKDGEDGLKKALEVVPDIIISDLMMPKMDGVELCSQLKQNEQTSHIPIILLTAKADLDSKLEGLQMGADDYLTKPFDLDELMIRVRNLIEIRVQLRERFTKKIVLEPTKIDVSSPDEVFIKKAIAIVDDNITNMEFNVESFQKEIGMSRMQLHRKLRALTNHSSSEFIRTLRLQRAAQLLSENGMNVAEAAYASGFNSLSYFNQCFKEKFGVNPSKYHPI